MNACDSEELFWTHNLFGILDMCRWTSLENVLPPHARRHRIVDCVWMQSTIHKNNFCLHSLSQTSQNPQGQQYLKNKHNLENSCKLLTIFAEQHHIPSQYTPQTIIAIFSNHPLFQSIVTVTMIYQNLWYLSLCLVRALLVLRTISQNWHW